MRMVNQKVKRLYRLKKDRIIGGVCAGIGNYFNLDPVLVRLIWIIASLIFGAGILAYLIAWIIIPEKKQE
jgi:phage shock protein PspC (stress-responsive transcriptional regulator)